MPRNIDPADRIRLTHMLEAARQAIDFSRGRSRQSLSDEPMFRRAVIHCVQEVGEAAVQVTDATRQSVPGVPWQQIFGMRHRLVHVYFAINLDLVWEVIAKDLQPLIHALEAALQP